CFMLAHERSGRAYREIGVPDAHHGLSHHRGDPASIGKLVTLNTYHVKLFSYYLEKLRSTKDGDGTLLDHMLMVYGSAFADGNLHTNEDLPILLAGGKSTGIKSGRMIRYAKGTPVTNLFLTLLDKLEVPLDNLGDSTGKLELLSV